MNYLLILSYDGSAYNGWHYSGAPPTIAATLARALEKLLQHPVSIEGASRTDRGVHALGQVATFSSKKPLDPSFTYRLNCLLPKDIVVLEMTPCPDNFSPSRDALAKTYRYTISNQPFQSPFERAYAWHVPAPLSLEAMEEASNLLIGEKDFAALTNVCIDSPSSTVRTLQKITITQVGSSLTFELTANAFLYRMVRNCIGLLTAVGQEKIFPSAIPELLEKKERRLLPMTAPPHALLLLNVVYNQLPIN